MSHLVTINIEVKSLGALADAAKVLGGRLVEASTYRWYGYSIGDYPLPAGYTEADLGKCDYKLDFSDPEHVGMYEVGVVRRKDGNGYDLLWDFWLGGFGLQDKIGQGGELLIGEYALAAATEAAMAQGWHNERVGDSVVIYHPEGGTLTVTKDGKVDAAGFAGGSCVAAAESVEAALGAVGERALKAEYFQAKARVRQGGA